MAKPQLKVTGGKAFKPDAKRTQQPQDDEPTAAKRELYGVFEVSGKGAKKIDVADDLVHQLIIDLGYMRYGDNIVHVTDRVLRIPDNLNAELHQRLKNHIGSYLPEKFEVGGRYVLFTKDTILPIWMKYTRRIHFDTDGLIMSLPEFKGDILRDDAQNVYFTFTNGVVHITAKGAKLKPYSVLGDKFVWSTQIVDHVYSNKNTKASEYDKFIFNLAGKDKKKFADMKWSLGYLCHNYLDKSNARINVFYDTTSSTRAEGGSGKDLLLRAVSCVRETLVLDGKQWSGKSDNTFYFSSVKESTQVLIISDPGVQSLFDALFVSSQGPFIVQRKFKAEMSITEPPKIAITSNKMFDAAGTSNSRRQVPHIISPFYRDMQKSGITRPVVHVHGKRLFDEWDSKEWDMFYKDIVKYVIHYLSGDNPKINFKAVSEQAFKIDNPRYGDFIIRATTPVVNEPLYMTKLVDEFIEEFEDLSDEPTLQAAERKTIEMNMSKKLRKWLEIIDLKGSWSRKYYKDRKTFTFIPDSLDSLSI